MERRLAEIETNVRADKNVRAPRFLFVTYAVEIEGEAPLICIAEAIDD
ncbi:MAG TPA: hypothetical protein VGJ82_20065 [Thermoanaerobaculia bacterium]|jgi:hypothetical protein